MGNKITKFGKIAGLVVINSFFIACNKENEELKPIPKIIDSQKIIAEANNLGEAMNYAVDKKISTSNARISSEDVKDIENDMVQYITINYDKNFEINYIPLKQKLKTTFNSSKNARTESDFDVIESNFNDVKIKTYLNYISYGLVPSMVDFRKKGGDTTDFDNFRFYYNTKIDSVINVINKDSELSDSTKLSLIYSSHIQKSTLDARLKLILNEMGVLSSTNYSGGRVE